MDKAPETLRTSCRTLVLLNLNVNSAHGVAWLSKVRDVSCIGESLINGHNPLVYRIVKYFKICGLR